MVESKVFLLSTVHCFIFLGYSDIWMMCGQSCKCSQIGSPFLWMKIYYGFSEEIEKEK